MAITMNNYLYQKFAGNVNLLPIREILINQLDPDGKETSVYNVNLVITNLEAESNYRFSPITKTTFTGNTITLGYKFEATIYIPYNEYHTNNLRTILENVIIYDYILTISLGTYNSVVSGYNPPEPVNSTAGLWINLYRKGYNPSHTIEIESVEYRPRMIIRFNQFLPDLRNIIMLHT